MAVKPAKRVRNRELQAFPNSQEDKGRPYGDGVANDCWEEIERLSDAIGGLLDRAENPWRSLYLRLQELPLWNKKKKRTQYEAFAAEMFHITALLHFTHAVHSLWKLHNQELLKKYYKLIGQEAITGAITSLYSCLDIHCHLMICLNEDEAATAGAKLVCTWNRQCPKRKKDRKDTWKMHHFFNNGAPEDFWVVEGPAQLRRTDMLKMVQQHRNCLRNRVVHACYQYVVPRMDPRGLYLLRSDLTLEELVEARGCAVENKQREKGKTGWDFVDPKVFYRPDGKWLDVRDLLKDLLEETVVFVEASSNWLNTKWG